ncbi:GNAT family N-acetyltransferase [Peptostreptococcaceae bacterium AGR-M142]
MKIIKLREEYFEQTAVLLCEVFSKKEPLTKNLVFEGENFLEFCRRMIKGFFNQGLSFIAVEEEIVVALLLARKEDLDFVSDDEALQLAPELSPVFELQDHLYQKAEVDIDPNRTVHLETIACHKDYCNNGLSKKLLLHTIEHLKEQNFKYVTGMCTSHKSQELFKKGVLDFFKYEIKYGDFFCKKTYPQFNELEDKLCKLIVGVVS